VGIESTDHFGFHKGPTIRPAPVANLAGGLREVEEVAAGLFVVRAVLKKWLNPWRDAGSKVGDFK